MKKHARRILFFLFMSSCPLIVTTVVWSLTFGQVFTFVGAISSGIYIACCIIAVLFAAIVCITIDDEEIPL